MAQFPSLGGQQELKQACDIFLAFSRWLRSRSLVHHPRGDHHGDFSAVGRRDWM